MKNSAIKIVSISALTSTFLFGATPNIGNIEKSRSLDKNLIDNSKLVVEYRN